MSRDVPFDPEAICDCCGEKGAFDFMGDLLCGKCTENIVDAAEEVGLVKPSDAP